MSDEDASAPASRVQDSAAQPVEASSTPEHAALPDQAILTALGEDRNLAAELLVRGHAAALGRTCMALLGSQHEAEDTLRETLLGVLDGRESFRGQGTLRAWLLGVARRRCARGLELRAREGQARQSLPVAGEGSTGAERLSLAQRARALLADIRPTEREALVLRYAAELSFSEVGQACGIDEATARQRVSRGLLRLTSPGGEEKS